MTPVEPQNGTEQSVDAQPAPLTISVVRGDPTSAEVAAVTAVVAAALEELAEESARESVAGTSAWQRSQRSVRGTITPGYGAWRSFSG